MPQLKLRRCRSWTFALVCALASGSPSAQLQLPSLGESAAQDFDAGAERRLGEEIMRQARRDPAFLDDPVLLEYLQSLWQPLVDAARQRGDVGPDTATAFAWESFLVRDRSVNAFALPGGFVGVHLGLIAITASRHELASVLAHELSHITQRHIARSADNASRASLVGLAALLVGIMAASRSNNADMANAAIMGGQAAAIQGQLNFSRDMEREADRIGYGVLVAAGFSPAGMAAMFEKLDAANRLNDSGSFPYLRSHPLTFERLGEARSRVMARPASGTADPIRHALMQARARVLMDTGAQALRRQQEQLAVDTPSSDKDRLAGLYAGALASSLLGDHGAAIQASDRAAALLLDVAPAAQAAASRCIALLQVQVRLAAGDAAAALKHVDALGAQAGARPEMLLRAQAAVLQSRQGSDASSSLRESVEALQTWVSERRQDAAAWALLAQAAEIQGQPMRALRASAESHAAQGDIGGAIDRLRAAQQMNRRDGGKDFIEASIVDARLRELQALRRLLALDARGGPRARTDPEQSPQ